MSAKPIEILVVEDNPGDVDLLKEALLDFKIPHHLNFVWDGVEALNFLSRKPPYAHAPQPDLILLDLNLPKLDGREVLAELKKDGKLKEIPVIILTSSHFETDLLKVYGLPPGSYIRKPLDFEQCTDVINSIQDFWKTVVLRDRP